ncbi:DUF2442 domain-containing protein [Terriglobus aquaticus]|uniref:DUF2442 domain-containing protein n=1 Tax=Terriglobus aquaticus TaxID=940139 RepID=A0ABW9KIL1_9BACT|nr:DUF2442 domain-containing protein [Terriglobus aquaticus]
MSAEIAEEELRAAEQRWEDETGCYPSATDVRFDQNWRRIIVKLSTGLEIALDPLHYRGFEAASDAALSNIEISGIGYELFFPLLDEGIWLPNTFRDSFPNLRTPGEVKQVVEDKLAA